MRPRILAVAVGVLTVALVAATTVATLRTRDLRRAEARLEALQEEVEDLRAEVAELETRGAPADEADPDGGPGSGLRDLFGGDDGPLAGLGGDVPGFECLTQAMAGGGLDSLLGGGSGATPRDPDELVDHIADEVEELRELELREKVDAELLSPDEIGQRLVELVLEDYTPEQADTDRRLLSSLGAVDPGTDLREMTRELLSSQVAGFYVPETGELVVRTGDSGHGPTEQIVLAHEIEHALADQALGLPDVDLVDDSDRQLAGLAVIEGDASLLMNLWALRNLSFAEQLGLAFDPALIAAQEELDEAPHFIAEQLTFPYFEGLEFVCRTWLEGGWRAVDGLYADPPESSAEVLVPGRYAPGDQVVEPPRLSAPPGWEHRATDTFGAAQLSWLFEAPGDATDRQLSEPLRRATVWSGGTATVWERAGASVVGLSLVGGAKEDGPSLCASMIEWYGAAFPDAEEDGAEPTVRFNGGGQDAVVTCRDDDVAVAIGPDLATAEAVAGA